MRLWEWIYKPFEEHASPERIERILAEEQWKLERDRRIEEWERESAVPEFEKRADRMKEAENMIYDLDSQRKEARRLIFTDDYDKRAMGYMWIHLLELRETMYGEE